MDKVAQFVLIAAITSLSIFSILWVAEGALKHQTLVCQEGC